MILHAFTVHWNQILSLCKGKPSSWLGDCWNISIGYSGYLLSYLMSASPHLRKMHAPGQEFHWLPVLETICSIDIFSIIHNLHKYWKETQCSTVNYSKQHSTTLHETQQIGHVHILVLT